MEDLIDPEFENNWEANFDYWAAEIWRDIGRENKYPSEEEALVALRNKWV